MKPWTYIDAIDRTGTANERVLIRFGLHVVDSDFKVRVRGIRELFCVLVITDRCWMIGLIMNAFSVPQLRPILVTRVTDS